MRLKSLLGAGLRTIMVGQSKVGTGSPCRRQHLLTITCTQCNECAQFFLDAGLMNRPPQNIGDDGLVVGLQKVQRAQPPSHKRGVVEGS